MCGGHDGCDRGPVTFATRTAPAAAVRRTRPIPVDLVTYGGMAAAALLFVTLQLGAPERFDPIRTTVSDLFHAPNGGWMFPLAVLALAAGSARIMGRLFRDGRRAAGVLVGLWCIGLILVAAFPTDGLAEATPSVSAVVHRYGGLLMFVALPLAGMAASGVRRRPPGARTRRHAVRLLSIASAVMGVVFLVSQLPQMVPGSPLAALALGLRVPGLAERVAFVVLLALLAALARTATAETSPARNRVVDAC